MEKNKRVKCAGCGRKTADPEAKGNKCRACRKSDALDNELFAAKVRHQDSAMASHLSRQGDISQSDASASGAIERRMIKRAVSLFTENNPPNRTAEFTTSNYSQALDEELGSSCDIATCVGHLKKMGGVSRISESIWCRNPLAAGDVDGVVLDPVDFTATMTNILHLLNTDGAGDKLVSGRSLAFMLGDQVLLDVGNNLEKYLEFDELDELDEFGDFIGGALGFRSIDDLEELAESLTYDGMVGGFRVGLVVTEFLEAALYSLETDGRIIRVDTPPKRDPMFAIAGQGNFVIVSKPGDACDCDGAIGKSGHCHNCGRALFGLHKAERTVLKHMSNCECGGTICERGYCDDCGDGLENTGDGLTPEDWQEIYDSLESQCLSIEDEDDEDVRLAENWRKHIRAIMAKIGPDGQSMASG